jgi:hypothetical protein
MSKQTWIVKHFQTSPVMFGHVQPVVMVMAAAEASPHRRWHPFPEVGY